MFDPAGLGYLAGQPSSGLQGRLAQDSQESRSGLFLRLLFRSPGQRPLLRLDRWAKSVLRWRVLATEIYAAHPNEQMVKDQSRKSDGASGFRQNAARGHKRDGASEGRRSVGRGLRIAEKYSHTG